MDIENKLEELKKIKAVDSPPFLLQSIKNRIQQLNEVEAPPVWKYAFFACAAIILLFNLSLFLEWGQKQESTQIGTVIFSLQLSETNQLYND